MPEAFNAVSESDTNDKESNGETPYAISNIKDLPGGGLALDITSPKLETLQDIALLLGKMDDSSRSDITFGSDGLPIISFNFLKTSLGEVLDTADGVVTN